MIFKRCLALGIITGLMMVIAPLAQAEEKAKQKTPPLMRQKLTAIQNTMEGLTTRDFDKIKESSDLLRRISLVNGWLRYEDKDYVRLTENFRATLVDMEAAADEENIEGATLFFTQTSVNCVQCHNLMRDRM